MMSTSSSRRSYLLAAAIAACCAQAARAQEAHTQEVEEVVVTGTLIRGGAEQGTLPVSVISADELAKQGSPSMGELVKALPSSQGVMGDANQFGAGYSLGSANINLRGLGSLRTLVLLNGKRLAPNPAVGVGVDVNLLPTAAIGRIEVLKDGAAATYGSDAVAGVVNFITRTDLDGLAVDGSYSYIPDSDGEYNANIAYGVKLDATDMVFAAGYRHRSQLAARDRDWSLRPYNVNPSGGWTGAGMPAGFKAGLTNTGATIVDPQCLNLGGVPTGTVGGISGSPLTTVTGATGCQTQYLALDNLMEDEDHYQVFGQINHRFSDALTFHAEALYAQHTAIEHSSPSYTPTQGPQGILASGVNSWYTVPTANPGLSGLLPQLTTAQQTAIQNGGGVSLAAATWRPLLVGGNPLTGGAKEDKRDNDSYRISLGLNGDINEHMGWNTAATYGKTTNDAHTPDIYVARMQLALSGLGGPNCTGSTPGVNGCEWLNPFSTAVARNIITGQLNTVPGSIVPNSKGLIDWIYGDFGYHLEQTVLAVDAGLSGDLGFSLPGGDIQWAFGAQYRENGYTRDPVDDTDVGLNPCPQNIVNPAATCGIPTGLLSFNSPLSQYDYTQKVKSAYMELKFPILESLNAQTAVRYEDYGGGIGSTTNPKLALYWQPLRALAFRGSLGTTFRAPSATLTANGLLATGNAFVAQALHYLPFDTFGNPDLKPETAFTYNVGALVNAGGFTGSVDFWRIELDDAIVADSGTQIVTAFFTGGNHCGSADYADIQARLTFNSGACGPATDLGRVALTNTNAQRFDISGVDANLRYVFNEVFGGAFTVGVDGTYNTKFGIGSVKLGNVQLQAAGDFIGTRGSTGGSLPRWKASGYLDYSYGIHNFRWTARHVSSMRDIRAVAVRTSFAQFLADDPGATVDAFTLHDFTYRLSFPPGLVASATVTNVFDKGPPLARLDLSYDPFIGSPIGRIIKVGLSKTFR